MRYLPERKEKRQKSFNSLGQQHCAGGIQEHEEHVCVQESAHHYISEAWSWHVMSETDGTAPVWSCTRAMLFRVCE
jgi:hypothetical protein